MHLDEALALVEESPDHRILRRIEVAIGELLMIDTPPTGAVHKGLFIDTETTGLDHAKDAVVEFCAVPFDHDGAGTLYGIGIPFHSYIDPGRRSGRKWRRSTGSPTRWWPESRSTVTGSLPLW
jgi:DNA polymerase-3 subunit epsilon